METKCPAAGIVEIEEEGLEISINSSERKATALTGCAVPCSSARTGEMAELSGNDYIAQILKDEGVEYLMCFPSNPLISAVAKVGIRPVAFRHERGAVMAADGYSRMMNREKFGVVAVQSQAGAENALGGMAQAYADNVPILVMLGGVTLNQIGVRPNFTAVEKYRGFAKQIEAIYDISHTADVMRRAMTAMRNGPLPPPPLLLLQQLLQCVCQYSAY
jgi:glyoxylate carboligase